MSAETGPQTPLPGAACTWHAPGCRRPRLGCLHLALHAPRSVPTRRPNLTRPLALRLQQAHADSVLGWSKKVFGSTLTNAVIRNTFYKQVRARTACFAG